MKILGEKILMRMTNITNNFKFSDISLNWGFGVLGFWGFGEIGRAHV